MTGHDEIRRMLREPTIGALLVDYPAALARSQAERLEQVARGEARRTLPRGLKWAHRHHRVLRVLKRVGLWKPPVLTMTEVVWTDGDGRPL